jgi:hypothetical protein
LAFFLFALGEQIIVGNFPNSLRSIVILAPQNDLASPEQIQIPNYIRHAYEQRKWETGTSGTRFILDIKKALLFLPLKQ